MKYITTSNHEIVLTAYLDYLKEAGERLPPGGKSFVYREGHFDFSDHRCLHDSWIQQVRIDEVGEGARGATRSIDIIVSLLGAFHDGSHTIGYRGVSSYDMKLRTAHRKEAPIGHGDWLIDELLPLPNGHISHEIAFSDGGVWKIECADIEYSWVNQ